MDRQDILKRILYPKCKTAIEFKFDNMIVNPLLSYISVQDIAKLYKIATSLKYSSKPKEKYAMINQILEPLGFKKMASGTNRVVYRHLNDYRVVLKVAIDRVGLSDNGNESRVQHLLKPFVTKCFEVSPCGTVGLFERVVPITSREEFIQISDDIFDLINNLVGKYVLEDIGEKFYMNYGLREGFGPVLLDYPYVFELDGRKLICNVQDPFTGNFCRGEIDYDIGYNNLICTKCGKRYLATELKSEEKSDKPKIIIKGEDSIMKCQLRRGNEVVNELNSKKPFGGTNTIRPRKEFNNLKCKLVTPAEKTEEEKEQYKTSIAAYDEVNLQVRLKGRPTDNNKAVDRDALRKAEIAERETKSIPVSFNEQDVLIPEIIKDTEMKVGIVNPEEPVKFEEFKPEKVVDDIYRNNQDSDETFNINTDLKDLDEDDATFRAEIRDGKIYNVDLDELVGYVLTYDNVDGEPDCNPDTYEDTEVESVEEYYRKKENEKFAQISTENTAGGYKTNKITSPIANIFSAPTEAKEEEKVEEFVDETTEDSNIPEVIIHYRVNKYDEDELSQY